MIEVDLLVVDAEEVVTPQIKGPVRGRLMDVLKIIPGGALAVKDGRIVALGSSDVIKATHRAKEEFSARGCFIVPGFVDAHTHPVFTSTREKEADLRVRGVSYEEITRRGGGIFRSVLDLRAASDAQIRDCVKAHLDAFLMLGTTTVEAKSGYGLSFEQEMRSLDALAAVADRHPVRVVPTFLGAHQCPPEYRKRRGEYLRELCERMIPEIARRSRARYCDVFCDVGAFDVEESRLILRSAERHGLGLRVHADELAASGGAELACDLRAATADHLVHVTEATIERMHQCGVQPVLLPGTVLSLGLKRSPPARTMIDKDLAVVLASDFNPGTSYLQSPLLLIALAVQILRMTVAECITALTANAAASLGLAQECGGLLPGMRADLVVIEGNDHLLLGYRLSDRGVRKVMVGGRWCDASAAPA